VELTLGSLFDGISGFPLAGARLGIKTLWGSEIEPFPIKVSEIRFPDMKQLGDITKINGAEIEPVDIVTGGSPCQDLSVAGKRAGLAGERSGLFMEMIRVVKEMRERDRKAGKPIRPRFMVWENVPGAFSSNKGEDFRAVLEETARIADETVTIPRPPGGAWDTCGAIMADGWSIAWRVLDAQYWGVPQRRRRIFLVADFGGQSAPEILFKRKGLSRHIAEGKETGQGTAADAERCFRETGQGYWGEGVGCLRAEGENRPNRPSKAGTGGNNGPMLAVPTNTTDRHAVAIRTANTGANGHGVADDVAHTLDGANGQAVAQINCQDKSAVLPFDTTQITSPQNRSNPCHTFAAGANPPAIIQCIEPGALSRGQGERVWDKCPTLRAEMGDNHPAVMTYQKVTGPLMANSHPGSYTGQDAYTDMLVAKPLSAQPQLRHREDMDTLITQHYSVRRLTPLECERLQDFPDGWTDIPGASDSARYKALGNSLAVVCAEYVLEGIKSII